MYGPTDVLHYRLRRVSGRILRYLGWWARHYSDTVLVVGGPLTVIAGTMAIVDSALSGDVSYLLKSIGILLLGLFIFVWPLFRYRNRAKPWHPPR
jgi:hypothetical protein